MKLKFNSRELVEFAAFNVAKRMGLTGKWNAVGQLWDIRCIGGDLKDPSDITVEFELKQEEPVEP